MKKKMKKSKIVKQAWEDEMNVEDLTTIEGGIEEDGPENPIGPCGLGCYQGSGGGTDNPTGNA